MAIEKQALHFALCFFLCCFLYSPNCQCSSAEGKYHIVGASTFLIQEGADVNRPLQDRGSDKGGEFLISHHNEASGSTWRDVLIQGLQRDKYLSNRIFSHVVNNLTDSSPLITNAAFSAPVTSGTELQGPEYTVSVSIGTPSVEQLVGIDTLSSLSWIQCDKCNGCASNPNFPIYVPKKSSSYRSVPCKTSKCPPLGADSNDFESTCDSYDQCRFRDTHVFAQGSEGDYIVETVKVGENTFNEFYMGCAYSFTPPRKLATSGRLGLGNGPLSLVSQKADGAQFSYCLPSYISASATGSLSLGKGSIPSSVKAFTPVKKVSNFASSAYILELEGISVGGERFNVSLQVPGADLPTITYIDTTIMGTQLVKPVHDALRSSFEEKLKKSAPSIKAAEPIADFQLCYQLSSIASVKIPAVTIHFKGNTNLDVPAIGTLLQTGEDVVCFPFAPSPNPAVNIIGNVQQQGIAVAFDNVNNRVGFGPGSC